VVGTAARSAYAAKNALGERCCLPICPGYRLESGSDHCPGLDSMGRTDTGHGRSPTGFCPSRQQRGGCGSHGTRHRGRRGVLARLGHDCPRDGNEVVARKIQLLCPLSLTAQFANAAAHEGILRRHFAEKQAPAVGSSTLTRRARGLYAPIAGGRAHNARRTFQRTRTPPGASLKGQAGQARPCENA
jgi:hypothetical protein